MRNSNAKAVKWYKDLLQILKEAGPVRVDGFLGQLMLIAYSPKDQKLAYYDSFPLIFPIERYNDSILGINLHYLDPTLRQALFDALIAFGVTAGADDRIFIDFRYKYLNEFTEIPLVKVCLKKYLFTNIGTWTAVRPTEWQNVVQMPLQSFQKRTSGSVWRTSRRKMRNKDVG